MKADGGKTTRPNKQEVKDDLAFITKYRTEKRTNQPGDQKQRMTQNNRETRNFSEEVN